MYQFASKNDIILEKSIFDLKLLRKRFQIISDFDYVSALYDWNQIRHRKQVQAYKFLKESKKFVSSLTEPSLLKTWENVIYVITYQKNILYTGMSHSSIFERYHRFSKTVLFSDYFELLKKKEHISDDMFDGTFEIFLRTVLNATDSYRENLEASYINLFSVFGIPSCNQKCENIKMFEEMLKERQKDHHWSLGLIKFSQLFSGEQLGF